MAEGYDLHIHTTASDGTLTPYQVIDEAVYLGLEGIALTDHDTVSALGSAEDYIKNKGLPLHFIPGVELNTELEDEEIHILGYYFDPMHPELMQHLQKIRAARHIRVEQMVERLNQTGVPLSLEEVQNLAQGEAIGRPHVARALINRGHVNSMKEAFDRYIGQNRAAYVPRYKFTPPEAIRLIKGAGGVSVLAHPGLIKKPDKIREIIRLGIEGLEVYYPEHSTEQQKWFVALAAQYRLLVTGGSDYHGPESHESRAALGTSTASAQAVSRLRSYLKANRY